MFHASYKTMKNLRLAFAALAVSAFIYSCGGESNDTADTAATEETQPAASAPADQATLVAEGKTLVEGSDCRACHANDQRLVGPAYNEVAERYHNDPGAVDMLAGKIIEGGSGNWGEVPMAPHPQISKEDATKMVHYVLSLRNADGAAPQTN
jgi:cytochrome c